jgi:predicted aspartyl protease
MRETDTMKTIEPNPPLLTPVGFAVAAAAAMAVAIIAFVLPQARAPSTWQSAPVVAQSRDAIPYRLVNGAMYVYANLGGVPHNMILDTGAYGSQITVPIANALLRRNQAYVVPGIFYNGVANGSVVPTQRVVVRTMRIGRHTLHNVEMIVADDGGGVLLGLSELRAIGSFTVDPSRSQIRFD